MDESGDVDESTSSDESTTSEGVAGLDPEAVLDELDLPLEIERAILNETEEGRRLAADFVAVFGDFVSTRVRPVLRGVASDGGEPQLLVNGLAELLRATADAIEFPLGAPR